MTVDEKYIDLLHLQRAQKESSSGSLDINLDYVLRVLTSNQKLKSQPQKSSSKHGLIKPNKNKSCDQMGESRKVLTKEKSQRQKIQNSNNSLYFIIDYI